MFEKWAGFYIKSSN